MPPLIALLAESLSDLPRPPGTTPTVTVPATPIASPTVLPVASPLVETTAVPATTPTVGPRITPAGGDGVDGLIVALIVVVVLGAVVLIAWLLKPLVARRLAGEEGAGSRAEAIEPPSTAWPARQDTPTSPPDNERVPDLDEPVGEHVSIDVTGEAPEEMVEEEPITEAATTIASAIDPVPSAAEAPSGSLEQRDTGVGAEAIVGITLTVRELLEFANAGQLLRGFDLYSESYLQRFRVETGLTDEQFAEEYGSIPAPPPEARIELAAVSDVEVLPDGRVSALMSFGNGEEPPRPERFVFIRIAGRWLIDDITRAG